MPLDEHRGAPTGNAPAARVKRGAGASNSRSNRLDRRLERAIRHSLRSTFGKLQKRLASDQFTAASDGDCMFFAGETWGARYDYDILRALRRGRRMKIAALCQDLIPITDPQFFESLEFVERYRRYVDFLLHDTDLVIAISQSTANELEKLKKAARLATRIEIVQLGSDFAPLAHGQPPRSTPHLEGRRFVLSVSTIQSRKNFDLLYRVWKRFAEERPGDRPSLVIVGQRGFGSDDLLWQISHDPAVKDSVFVLHGVSDEELAWLYRNCCFTCYPSFAEGWGLPISESLLMARSVSPRTPRRCPKQVGAYASSSIQSIRLDGTTRLLPWAKAQIRSGTMRPASPLDTGRGRGGRPRRTLPVCFRRL